MQIFVVSQNISTRCSRYLSFEQCVGTSMYEGYCHDTSVELIHRLAQHSCDATTLHMLEENAECLEAWSNPRYLRLCAPDIEPGHVPMSNEKLCFQEKTQNLCLLEKIDGDTCGKEMKEFLLKSATITTDVLLQCDALTVVGDGVGVCLLQ